ncbi:MAG: GNAT family N-acetyltransferase, partial [Actinomycetes bacterium]
RMASVDDLDAVVDLAGIVDPPSDGVDVDRDYYSSILEHGRLSVADASGIVIGYCGAIPVGGTRHLSDLFVHPDAHARGIGGQLLEAVWDAPASEVPRHTFSSVHPSALPLYVRAGMRPLWPLLYIEGPPESLPRSRLTLRDLEAEEAADVEAVWLGWERLDQYRYWASRPGGRTFVALDGETPVAVGCLSRSRDRHTLLHMAVVDQSLMPESVSAAVTLASSSVLLAAPGMSAVVPFLVDAGWRIVEHDVYCASDADLVDAERLIPHPGLL